MNLDGTWKVEVTEGPWWFKGFNLARDKKIISDCSGYNTTPCGIKWGYFAIEPLGRNTQLIYDDLPIVDIIHPLEAGIWTGKFLWKGQMVGRFRMIYEGVW